MAERPILMSAPMVLALRREVDPKTVTRRTAGLEKINESPDEWTFLFVNADGKFVFQNAAPENSCIFTTCPYWRAEGDRLWVRETWTGTWLGNGVMHLMYAADGCERAVRPPWDYVLPKAAAKVGNWVSPLFIPRWASRDTLEVVSVRPERLHEITEKDAVAEGCTAGLMIELPSSGVTWTARENFQSLWRLINGPESWTKNPWVWRVEYRRLAS